MQGSKPVTVLWHHDADGFASAYAAWRVYQDTATYIAVQYSQPVPEIPEGTTHLLIVDFSYDRETCDALAAKYALLVIDHHRSAEENLRGSNYAIFSMNKSGCALTWEYFHKREPMPAILAYVQDRDLWKFELPNSEEVSLYIATLPFDFEDWHKEATRLDFSPRAWKFGSYLRSFRNGQIQAALRDVRVMFWDIHEVPVLNCSANVSEVGNELCRAYPDAPFSATYCDRKGVRSWSLRSVGGFDVSEIARRYGGGGHSRAAGFATPIGTWPENFLLSLEPATETTHILV